MGRRKPRFTTTERVGVNAVEGIVLKELNWIFREQPIVDFGIDAHIELVTGGSPTGKLLALQIKSGASHFKSTKEGYVYHGDLKHLDYWLGHALPVILVAHFPKTGETLWVQVTADVVKRTGKKWRISIPKGNKLGATTKGALEQAFEGTPGQQRLRKLTIDLPLMRHVKSGNKVSVELQDWVNKSLGRTSIKVFIDDRRDENHSDYALTYFTGYSISSLAEALFPWAKVSVDLDFYEMNYDLRRAWYETSDPEDEYEDELAISTDSDDNVYPYTEMGGGEVLAYRLKLDLNKLGKAFLTVSDHLEDSDDNGWRGKLS